jgi:hypothetical protein
MGKLVDVKNEVVRMSGEMGDTKIVTRETAGPQEIVLPQLRLRTIKVTLVGDSPLISHKWSEKAMKMMLDKQMKKAKAGREAKNPKKDYEDSLYKMSGGKYGFPAIAFKAAAVNACSHVDGITKVVARGAFHIPLELVEIKGKPQPRKDIVRIDRGSTADIRFRGEFKKWSCEVPIVFNENVISAEQIANLLNTAGFAIGVGEWRPQKNGNFGMFHVLRTGE